MQLGKLGGDELSVAGLGDDTVEIDGRRDLDQAAISGPFNCDAGRGSPPIIWARGLFIISAVNRHRLLLPHAVVLLEEFAERGDRDAVAAGGPIAR